MTTPVRIVIFAKAPLPGFAKTRLIPALGAAGAAQLAEKMLVHTLHQALAAQVGTVELCVTPAITDATSPVWQTLNIPPTVQWSEQGEGGLGERLARATQRVIEGGESLLLIGSDCPELMATHLRGAAQTLQHSDATLLPTADGGYALLGLSRFHPSVFSDVAWSTDAVAVTTLYRLEQLGWRTTTHHNILYDIDEPDDLQHLPKAWLAM